MIGLLAGLSAAASVIILGLLLTKAKHYVRVGLIAASERDPILRSLRRRRRNRCIEREVPIVASMYVLCLKSGMNVRLATEAVSQNQHGELAKSLTVALSKCERGSRLADALVSTLPMEMPSVAALADALTCSERYGAPVSTVLERVARQVRRELTREAERRAKNLSVQLLFPVAGCTLPAFALLTVAPLIAGSIEMLAFF